MELTKKAQKMAERKSKLIGKLERFLSQLEMHKNNPTSKEFCSADSGFDEYLSRLSGELKKYYKGEYDKIMASVPSVTSLSSGGRYQWA